MNKTYRAETGTAPRKIVEHFEGQPDDELSSAQIAEMCGIAVKNVSGAMANAVKAGLLAVRRQGRGCFYTKGDGVPLPDAGPDADDDDGAAQGVDAAREPSTLQIALYNDGEMTITGAREIEGGILLTRAMAAALREYLLHTGSFIEQLRGRHDHSQPPHEIFPRKEST